ncbi:hypothetical protein Godav_021060, partial [Gossypium davidsonii]|nr:hypothetical protein [Gossypium davidsonii]
MEEVIQIDAAMTIHHLEVSGLVSYHRLLQEVIEIAGLVDKWSVGTKEVLCSNLGVGIIFARASKR